MKYFNNENTKKEKISQKTKSTNKDKKFGWLNYVGCCKYN